MYRYWACPVQFPAQEQYLQCVPTFAWPTLATLCPVLFNSLLSRSMPPKSFIVDKYLAPLLSLQSCSVPVKIEDILSSHSACQATLEAMQPSSKQTSDLSALEKVHASTLVQYTTVSLSAIAVAKVKWSKAVRKGTDADEAVRGFKKEVEGWGGGEGVKECTIIWEEIKKVADSIRAKKASNTSTTTTTKATSSPGERACKSQSDELNKRIFGALAHALV